MVVILYKYGIQKETEAFCLALFLFFLLSSHQANKMNCLEIARKFNESVSARGCSLMKIMYATIVCKL